MIALAVTCGALLVLGLMPVGVRAVFETELAVYLTLFGIRIQIFPGRQTPEHKPKKAKKQAPSEEKKKLVPKGELQEYLRLLTRLLGKLHRKICIRELTLHAIFGGSSPELNYGRAWAVIGGIMPLIEANFRIQKRDVGAFLSEDEKSIRIVARAHAVMTLASILRIALHALFGYLKLQKNDQKKAV